MLWWEKDMLTRKIQLVNYYKSGNCQALGRCGECESGKRGYFCLLKGHIGSCPLGK